MRVQRKRQHHVRVSVAFSKHDMAVASRSVAKAYEESKLKPPSAGYLHKVGKQPPILLAPMDLERELRFMAARAKVEIPYTSDFTVTLSEEGSIVGATFVWIEKDATSEE